MECQLARLFRTSLVSRRDAHSMLDAMSWYPLDLQERSLETDSPTIAHCDEFSERAGCEFSSVETLLTCPMG